jgi:hypothetical protein
VARDRIGGKAVPYWLTEILRRTRRRSQRAATAQDEPEPHPLTAEERAAERVAWEEARQRVQERQRTEGNRRDRQPPAEESDTR